MGHDGPPELQRVAASRKYWVRAADRLDGVGAHEDDLDAVVAAIALLVRRVGGDGIVAVLAEVKLPKQFALADLVWLRVSRGDLDGLSRGRANGGRHE
jgi:hypothetical protein